MKLGFKFGLIALTCAALPALAQNTLEAGCYERIYSAAHLAENPNQGVESIRLEIRDDQPDGYVLVSLAARMSTQGQARRDRVAGQVLEQGLFCPRDGSSECYVECDGGGIKITSQSDSSLTFQTGYVVIGDDEDGCGGTSTLVEPGAALTTYRLNAVAPALCEGLRF